MRKRTEIEIKNPNKTLIVYDLKRTSTRTFAWGHKTIMLGYFTVIYFICSVV